MNKERVFLIGETILLVLLIISLVYISIEYISLKEEFNKFTNFGD